MNSWFGIYCPYHNIWLRRGNGEIIHYPVREIAEAEMRMELAMQQESMPNTTKEIGIVNHLWEVCQFGQQIKSERRPGSCTRFSDGDDYYLEEEGN